MPLFADRTLPTVLPAEAPQAPPDPTLGEAIRWGFEMESDVVNALELMSKPAFPRDDNFNLKSKLQETGQWDNRNNYIGVRSDAEFNYVLAQIEHAQKGRDVLARSGLAGTLAMFAAGAASPTIFMPFIGQSRGIAAAGKAAMWSLAGATAQEIPLILNQPTRTGEEVAFSLAASTVLGGMLGGAVGFMTKAEREAFDMAFGMDPKTISPSPAGAQSAIAEDAGQLARGAQTGARVLDTNPLTRSPVTYNIMGESPKARWTTAQLSDAGLVMERNAAGVPTTPGGTAENATSRHYGRYADAALSVDDIYNNYILDGNVPLIAPRLRAGIAGRMDPERLSKPDFRKEVSRAIREGGDHANPAVDAAAKKIIRDFYDPILKEAQETGVIAPELKDIVDAGYLNRVFDHDAIAADVTNFVSFLAKKFNEKYQAQFATRLEKFQLRQARTDELLDDLRRSPEEIQDLRDRFGRELADIETLKEREHFNALEDSVALLRGAARRIDGTTLAGKEQRKQFLKDARDMENSSDLFVRTRQRERELKRRLSNLNKARIAVEEKLANKLEKIERAEELSLATLKRSTMAAQKILAKMDRWSDETLDAEISKLKNQFARTAEVYDRGEDRIAKLTQQEAERVGPFTPDEPVTPDRLLAAEALQQRRADRLSTLAEKIEKSENIDRAEVRDILNEILDETLGRAQRIVEKRAVRQDRLRRSLDDLSPEAFDARLRAIEDAKRTREADFAERIRVAGGDDLDINLGKVDFSAQARKDAELVKDKIQGTYLRLPAIEVMQGERGPQLARLLDIPSKELEPWLENDIDKLMKIYVRTMAPDIEIMRKLGTVNGEEQFAQLIEEMNVRLQEIDSAVDKKGNPLSEEAKRKERVRVQNEYKLYKTNLEGIIGRLRGTFGLPKDFDGVGFRMAQVAMHLNVLRFMGGVTITSLPDVARPIMRYGLLRTFRDGFVPLLTNLKRYKMTQREARLAGVAIDVVTAQRANSVFDLLDDLGRGSKFERGVEYASGKMGLMAGFSYWTDTMKVITASIANAKAMDSVMDVVTGKGSKAATEFLAQNGIDAGMAQRIAEQVEKYNGGGKVDGIWLPQTENWQDEGAIRAFRALVAREANNTIITPGVERPLWVNASSAGRLLAQFKSFAMASTYKTILAGLQQRDTNFLIGSTISLAMGAVSYYLYAMARGKELPDPTTEEGLAKWADEAIQRSGLTAVLGLAQDISSRIPATAQYSSFSGGRSTRRGGDDLVEAVLGPTFDLGSTAAGVLSAVHDPTEATVHQARTLLPWQNVSHLAWLFDAVEKSIAVKERR